MRRKRLLQVTQSENQGTQIKKNYREDEIKYLTCFHPYMLRSERNCMANIITTSPSFTSVSENLREKYVLYSGCILLWGFAGGGGCPLSP